MGPVKPGIVTGLTSEAAIIARTPGTSPGHPLVVCKGPGQKAARVAAEQAIDAGVDGLISFGIAGGIDNSVTPGTLLLPREVREGRINTYKTDDEWRSAIKAAVRHEACPNEAPLATVNRIVRSAEEKTRIRDKTDAVAVDMESLAVAEAAHEAGLPFVVIRAVCDPALQSLPMLTEVAVGADGNIRPWKVLWSLMRNPLQLKELPRLSANTRSAMTTLFHASSALAPDFRLPDYRGRLIRQLRATGSGLI